MNKHNLIPIIVLSTQLAMVGAPRTLSSLPSSLSRLGSLLHLAELTRALSYRNVYHVRSQAEVPMRNRWTCGYHAIYNIIKIERSQGISNSSNSAYEQACKKHANPQRAGNSGSLMKIISELGLQPAAYLNFQRGHIRVVSATNIANNGRGYQCNRCHRMHVHHNSVGNAMQIARETLKKDGPQCVHFVCHVQSGKEEHCVLLSVVKTNQNELLMIIMDNMNGREPHATQQQMRAYVEYLYKELNLG